MCRLKFARGQADKPFMKAILLIPLFFISCNLYDQAHSEAEGWIEESQKQREAIAEQREQNQKQLKELDTKINNEDISKVEKERLRIEKERLGMEQDRLQKEANQRRQEEQNRLQKEANQRKEDRRRKKAECNTQHAVCVHSCKSRLPSYGCNQDCYPGDSRKINSAYNNCKRSCGAVLSSCKKAI